MAFNKDFLFSGRAVYNACDFGLAPAWHSYRSLTDSMDTILSLDYFPSFFDDQPNDLLIQPNDIIFIIGSDARIVGLIQTINPVGIVIY